MQKSTLIVNSAGAKIAVSSSGKDWLKKFVDSDFLQRYVPAVKITLHKNKTGADCFLVLKRGGPRFSISYPRAIYQNKKFNEKDVITLLDFMLERAREERKVYCLHSSSISLGGEGIVFWGGASGMGKTRLMLAMSSKFGANFYSDEKTLINLQNNKMVGGARSAYLSKPHFKNRYGARTFLDFKNNAGTPPIRLFVHPIVTDSKKLAFERWPDEKFEWHLYEELSRKIRGTSRRLFKNTVPVPSLDTPALSKKRSLAVKKYTRKIPCYFMKGSENVIAKKILLMLKKSSMRRKSRGRRREKNWP